MQKNTYYTYSIETKEGIKHAFYTSNKKDINVFESVPDFDYGKHWIIDAGNDQKLFDTYDTFSEDNSFVLIPKSSVVNVLCEKATIQPKKINSTKNALNIFKNILKK